MAMFILGFFAGGVFGVLLAALLAEEGEIV